MAGYHRTRFAVCGAILLILVMAAPASAADVAGRVPGTPEQVADEPDPTTRPTMPPRSPAALPTPISTVTAPPEWSPARCATGAITDVRADRDESGAPRLWISGWIQPCADAASTNGFTVVRFYGGTGVRSRGPVPYQSMSGPTPFTFQISGIRLNLAPDMTALCVAYAVDGRVACLGVDAGGPGELPVAAPIPTDDPRVLGPVSREHDYTPDPTCGTCL
ncbi:hypothetical protein [Micromonospora deserti]|uniref:Uncharacterized protein n=1 Tax=Micromonospora deserti TaxID=2070366 RepID=A0A2W2CVP1_9ACTN|nr:hypothetical protein [Micromonospora deserti]PZG01971.1 hypothetical protein C1I99_04565 [Micromonospora deserti]